MKNSTLKSLVFLMVGALMLVASCSVPEIEEVVEINPRTTIPFSVVVATDMTKVSYADAKYAFKTGDSFVVESGSSERDDIEGTLAFDGDKKLKGEISFETEKGLDNDTPLKITLINADNSDKNSYAKGIAATLQEAVEKYSLFTTTLLFNDATTESSPQRVSFAQQAAFLEVTVEFTNVLNSTMPTGETPAEIIASDGTVISTGKGRIVEGSAHNYQAVFVAAVPGGTEMKGSKLSICEREVTILPADGDSKVVGKNKKYTLEPRSVDFGPQLGDPFWSDGSYGRISHPAGVSVIGIIVYVNDGSDIGNALTEKNGDDYGHALVMSLYNVFSEGKAWDSNVQLDENKKPYGGTLYTSNTITSPAQTMDVSRLSGLANTNKINASGRTDMPAYYASQYRPGESDGITNTTGWFLPSIGQWIYTISKDGFGGANPASEWVNNASDHKNWLTKGSLSDLVLVMPATTSNALTESLNARMKVLDDDFSCGYDSFGMTSGSDFSDNYWTSSEYSANEALRMNFGSVETYNGSSYSTIKADPEPKDETWAWKKPFIMKIRPFLAF